MPSGGLGLEGLTFGRGAPGFGGNTFGVVMMADGAGTLERSRKGNSHCEREVLELRPCALHTNIVISQGHARQS